MPFLSSDQLENGYFREIGGFPGKNIITTVAEYDGSGKACIACTQLEGRYSDAECRKILRDWVVFLKNNAAEFHALHFNSRVPQALFEAACAQHELVELRCKWGSYVDLSPLLDLSRLEYLYLGSGSSVRSLFPIPDLDTLRVLYLGNFRKISDYSVLAQLSNLEQLVISGPDLGNLTIDNIDFVCRMPNLRSIWLPNTSLLAPPTDRGSLRSTGTRGVFGQEWWDL